MQIFRVVSCLLVLICLSFFGRESLAQPEGARLEFGVSWRHGMLEGERRHASYEIGASVGLSKQFGNWVTVFGGGGITCAGLWDGAWRYRAGRKEGKAKTAWGLLLSAGVDVALWPGMLGVSGGLNARSYFVPERAGIFRVDAALGLVAWPFSRSSGILVGTRLGLYYHFGLVDRFDEVFGLWQRAPWLSLSWTWQY